MDPLYSPGSDFIGLSNGWITDLIVRDTNGENIMLRTMIYELAHKELLSGWINIYKNKYGLFGKTQIMLMKIIWDWASYWAIPTIIFINKGYTDIDVLKHYSASNDSIGLRFAKLNERMQELFQSWGQHHIEPCSGHQLNVFDLACLRQFQTELVEKYQPAELMPKVASNLKILELISAEIFRLVSEQINGTPHTMNVDPYNMTITDGKKELLRKSTSQYALPVDENIRADIAVMWFIKIKTPANEFAG